MYIKQTPISARNKQSVDSSKKVYQIQDFPDGAIKLLEQVVPDETRGRIACVLLQILFICISSGFDQGGGYGDTGGGYINSPGFGSPQQSQEKRVGTITQSQRR